MPTSSICLDDDTGKAANPRIAHVARTMGMDMSGHLTTAKDDFIARSTDLFVCMEPIHVAQVKDTYKTRNVILLGLFGDPKRIYIHDPYASTDAYARSEEHTSELQSRGHLVCRLLLEKKKS